MIDTWASILAARGRQDYLGMQKTSEDVSRYVLAITRTRPELIIECGTRHGKSAEWFAGFAPVVSIDIDANCAFTLPPSRYPVTWLCGSSIDPDILARVEELAAGKRVLVSLDSDHEPDHVLAEMEAYGPMVSPGGYMVVEDGIIRAWMGTSSPLDAIEKFLPVHPEWIVDAELEDTFPVTLFPCGWLRKGM